MRPWSMLEVFIASTAGSPLKPLCYGGNRRAIRQSTAVARGPNKACPNRNTTRMDAADAGCCFTVRLISKQAAAHSSQANQFCGIDSNSGMRGACGKCSQCLTILCRGVTFGSTFRAFGCEERTTF